MVRRLQDAAGSAACASGWRHEQQSVRMALNAAAHHSAAKVAAREKESGLTGTDDVQCRAARRSDGAGAAGRSSHGRFRGCPQCRCWPCRFWHSPPPRAVACREEKGGGGRAVEGGVRPAGGGVAPGVLGVRSGAPRVQEEEEKEEEEGRLPEPLPLVARAHRRQWQWYVHGWLRWFSAFAVSPSFLSFRPHAARLHGRYGPEGQYSVLSSSTPAVACARLVLLVFYTSRCVPPVVVRPRCSASWPV